MKLKILVFTSLIAFAVFGAPIAINNMIVPHRQDESGFPATAALTQGAILFGTDAGVLYMSPGDGGSWQPLDLANSRPSSHLTGFFPGVILSAGTVINQSRFSTSATFNRLTASIVTAGSDGAHNFTVDVYDLTTTTVVCVTGNIACNATGITGVACSSSVAAADDVQLRVNDSACLVTAPILGMAAEYR